MGIWERWLHRSMPTRESLGFAEQCRKEVKGLSAEEVDRWLTGKKRLFHLMQCQVKRDAFREMWPDGKWGVVPISTSTGQLIAFFSPLAAIGLSLLGAIFTVWLMWLGLVVLVVGGIVAILGQFGCAEDG